MRPIGVRSLVSARVLGRCARSAFAPRAFARSPRAHAALVASLATTVVGTLLAAPLVASQIRVPGDHPTLQAALDAAAPGDVILVQTPIVQEEAVIAKPVTIVGDPLLRIEAQATGCIAAPLVRLQGSGFGTVVIANARIASNKDCATPPLPLGGGGFETLVLSHVEIPEPLSGTSGYGHGVEGLRVSGVPYVVVEDCEIRSAQNDTDDCYPHAPSSGLGVANHAAVDIGAGTLLVVDSLLQGGNGGKLCSEYGAGCPSGVANFGGEGASAVKAAVVHQTGSQLVAGAASSYIAWQFGEQQSSATTCHVFTSYASVIAPELHELPSTPKSTGAARIGKRWTIEYDLPHGPAFAFVSFGVGAPIALAGAGIACLEPATTFSLGVFTNGGAGELHYTIPNDKQLVGLVVCHQSFHASLGLLRPNPTVIVP